MEIITTTLSEAHEAACDAIMNQYSELDIQTHIDKKEFTLEYTGPHGMDDGLTLRILQPWLEPKLSDAVNYGPKFTEAYAKQFLTLTPPREDGKGAVYTYYNRLKDYPHTNNFGTWMGNGDGCGFDQMRALVAKLSKDPNNRRGVVVTWNPLIDAFSTEPPCMDIIQAIIRNKQLHLRVMFRSQDMLMGLPENLIGCEALQAHLVGLIRTAANDLNYVKQGHLTIFSWTPHIYKKRDGNEFDKMRATIHAKKSLCAWHPLVRI